LEYFIPIPLKTSNCSFMSGAQEILYNHLGVPNHTKEVFVAYGVDGSENYNW
jgi:hypothetical protein